MKEVSYNNFLQMVDEGKVSKVEITDKRLAAVDKNNEKKFTLQAEWKTRSWLTVWWRVR